MKIIEIRYTSRFLKKLKRIPKIFINKIDKNEEVFRNDCFDLSLKTHKLNGKMEKLYAFSITHSYRIVFEFIKKNVVVFIDIGDHSIYK